MVFRVKIYKRITSLPIFARTGNRFSVERFFRFSAERLFSDADDLFCHPPFFLRGTFSGTFLTFGSLFDGRFLFCGVPEGRTRT